MNQRIDLLRAEEKDRKLEERLRKAEETARRIDLLRAEEKNRELEERLRKAEEAARAAVNELWETRFEMAKDELKEEMRNIVSSTASGADQRIPVEASTEISQLSLHLHSLQDAPGVMNYSQRFSRHRHCGDIFGLTKCQSQQPRGQ